LVGLPNAGKSTLLRAVSNSRARVGSWAFTTLQPNIGTVILDDHKGRPSTVAESHTGRPSRTRFTIADIPGLIEDAHLNKGLGLDFLRHVERASILAFVVDLSAGDAVEALNALWREVGEYEFMKERLRIEESQRIVQWNPFETLDWEPTDVFSRDERTRLNKEVQKLPELPAPPIAIKPWFVVATKADVDGTQDNFMKLQAYIAELQAGNLPHPSGRENARTSNICALPISGIKGEGVDRVVSTIVQMLEHA
jgi:GTP-binding protein